MIGDRDMWELVTTERITDVTYTYQKLDVEHENSGCKSQI
jgi:hypothetical protein